MDQDWPGDGRPWSLLRLCAAAGLTEASGRALVRLGHLDPDRLRATDVVAARVAHALAGSVTTWGSGRPRNAKTVASLRDRLAVTTARVCAERRVGTDTWLVVTADNAAVAAGQDQLGAAVVAAASGPVLILPVGSWVRELFTTGAREAA